MFTSVKYRYPDITSLISLGSYTGCERFVRGGRGKYGSDMLLKSIKYIVYLIRKFIIISL